jgi:hypothetical protein
VRVLMTRMLLTGHDLLLLAPRPLQVERHIAPCPWGPARPVHGTAACWSARLT